MPITYTYQSENKIILEHPEGIISIEDIMKYFEDILSNPDIPSGVIDIVPFHDIEDFAMKENDHWKLIELTKNKDIKQKIIAIIFIASKTFHVGLARMYQSIFTETGAMNIHIVKTDEEACKLAEELLQNIE